MFFQLSEMQANDWRLALGKATAHEVQTWVAAVNTFDVVPPYGHEKFDLVERFFREVSPPARVIGVLECLVDEQLLTREAATQIEEKVLDRVNAQGAWGWVS
jgi:hypothetical protein